MVDVKISNVYTNLNPALIYNEGSEMVIESCDFSNFNGTGIEVSNSDEILNIINTNFTNGGNIETGKYGGVL